MVALPLALRCAGLMISSRDRAIDRDHCCTRAAMASRSIGCGAGAHARTRASMYCRSRMAWCQGQRRPGAAGGRLSASLGIGGTGLGASIAHAPAAVPNRLRHTAATRLVC